MKYALAIVMVFALVVPAMAFEMTSGFEYGYINETTITAQGPVSTQAISANSNEVNTKGCGLALSASAQENSAFAMKMGPVGVSNTDSKGGSVALSLGNGKAAGENAGLSTAQTGTVIFDITKQGAGYHGRYLTITH